MIFAKAIGLQLDRTVGLPFWHDNILRLVFQNASLCHSL
jgi:hypothetical protein